MIRLLPLSPAMLTNAHANTHALCSWKIHLSGPEGTLYDGEQFILQFKFNTKYPFDSPQVLTSTLVLDSLPPFSSFFSCSSPFLSTVCPYAD